MTQESAADETRFAVAMLALSLLVLAVLIESARDDDRA
jgi:hypothetical protein